MKRRSQKETLDFEVQTKLISRIFAAMFLLTITIIELNSLSIFLIISKVKLFNFAIKDSNKTDKQFIYYFILKQKSSLFRKLVLNKI